MEAVTTEIRNSVRSIKDSKRKEAAQKWLRSGSRAALRSLNAVLKTNDAGQKTKRAGEAKQKLEEVRKLLE